MVCGSLPRCDSEPFAHEPGLWWDGGRGVRKCPGICFQRAPARPVHCWSTRREIFISSRLVRASKVRGWAPRPVACRCRSHKARSLAFGAFGFALALWAVVDGGRARHPFTYKLAGTGSEP